MPDSLEFVDRQWESRSTASILIAEAIDSLMAQGMGEHDAIGALEDALQTRRIILNMQITQD
ncbi:hypothetical protein LJR098_006037 [Rhizobium sp. LjRoot98]|uniref:hypothetical protein n=1 Tax=unclassified Rhizobium TaxID=2613769 RepID=UPI000712610C|nr:hypothetical protein [Rhizobium sp. Root1204]KQV41533.1 hypothetical protein ASC96_17100 [Rhizobium sp. Root1204]